MVYKIVRILQISQDNLKFLEHPHCEKYNKGTQETFRKCNSNLQSAR